LAFKNTNYEGGDLIVFDLGTIVNPISARDIGNIIIYTYIQVGSTFYLVDEVTLSDQITTKAGLITPLL
jgi:hypothetical protein